ncbi:hypothetical protein ABZ914_03795 [Spirillospora sp. NPDC046719]
MSHPPEEPRGPHERKLLLLKAGALVLAAAKFIFVVIQWLDS